MDYSSTYNPYFDRHPGTLKAAADLASVVRRIIRASASTPLTVSPQAAEEFERVMNVLNADAGIFVSEIIGRAADLLTFDDPIFDLTTGVLSAARSGAKYLIEASADDPLGKARASRHRSEFIQAIEMVHFIRDENRGR